MTYNEDPTRWTSSPDDAPELLRGAFAAGRDEGPNRAQMRSLALKIAAASAGGAVAVGTVKAASAGQAVATAATWSVGKIATAVALAGALVTGGALVWQASSDNQGDQVAGNGAAVGNGAAPQLAEPAHADTAQLGTGAGTPAAAANRGQTVAQPAGAPVVEALVAPTVPGEERASAREQNKVDGVARAGAASADARRAPVGSSAKSASALGKTRNAAVEKDRRAASGAEARAPQETTGAKAAAKLTKQSEKATAPQSEIELLHRAQVALQARPHEAFQLTQEHRRLYPAGEFAQERDALAIQALMRVGDTEKARDLAASFIRAYPSSPHAHRFREAMGLH
jgi:hypothetical protein